MFPLAYARDASIKRRRPHSSSTAVSPLTRERSSRHAQCLRPRRHAMLPSMCSQLILASALFAVLTSHMIAAQVEDLPPFEELKGCSTYEIFSCYQQYTRLLSWVTLVENSEGRSVAEAYRKACSDLTETSNCYAGLTRCSENLRANFTRRENGYRALRALVCDTSTLQGYVMTRNCTNVEEFKACADEYKKLFNATYDDPYSPELPCSINRMEKACYEKGLNSPCAVSLERRKQICIRILDMFAELYDCRASGHSTVAPLPWFFALVTVPATLYGRVQVG
ncbi:uncharacterized protein [Dermacentor andersoni]|uniref:uncharacterized protein isoform X1 n=1 Tax=Dermacentor andersoni TaxID=34620 RepID=UPI003B3BA3F0